MPVLRASISERDGTSLSAGTAKRRCDIDAHYLRLPSHSSDYPSFSIVSGLCTGRFAKSLAASAERSHGLRTVDLHFTVFKSWCGRGILKRSHWRIWLHAIVGKQVRLLGRRPFCPTPKPIASGATLRRIVSRIRGSVRIGMAFDSAVGEQEHTARDRQTLRRGVLGFCGNGRGGCQRPQRVVAALYPDRSLSFTMMLDMLPDGYDQHHEHDL
jgi:hypothetical protein